jgi:hypothetical protein
MRPSRFELCQTIDLGVVTRNAGIDSQLARGLECGAELFCGLAHVLQRRDGFWPCSCFQAAVGIDPELGGCEDA